MNTIDRRNWLKCAGAMALGVGLVARAEPEFASADPGNVNVDADKLAKAVAFIDAEVKAGSMPGAALVGTRRGRKFVEHYIGTYRGFDGADKPFDPTVASALFSFSKGISATVAVMAHQDGLIDYDVPVSTYIPEFKGGGKETISLRHLMTHSAGIPSIAGGSVLTDEQWAAFVKKVCDASIEWPVGSKSAYHGVSGLFVVAEAVRRVSGMKSWNDICRERLFDPIGATSLAFGPFRDGITRATTPGYFTSDENGLAGHPAGGCFGTVDDMLRVLNLIVQGGKWHGRTLIQPEPLKEMLSVQYAGEIAKAVAEGKTPTHEPWGLGWLVRGPATCPPNYWFGFGDSKSPTLFGHAGVDTVYGVGDPARELAFVFIITEKAKSAEEATRLRRETSNLLQDAVTVA
ncbi:MAG: serine hydrolase domain-containing protein [FCB group bacterium]|nr:serine hydrolase domain-containing protein [FCB group bacterium]